MLSRNDTICVLVGSTLCLQMDDICVRSNSSILQSEVEMNLLVNPTYELSRNGREDRQIHVINDGKSGFQSRIIEGRLILKGVD